MFQKSDEICLLKPNTFPDAPLDSNPFLQTAFHFIKNRVHTYFSVYAFLCNVSNASMKGKEVKLYMVLRRLITFSPLKFLFMLRDIYFSINKRYFFYNFDIQNKHRKEIRFKKSFYFTYTFYRISTINLIFNLMNITI